MPPEQRCRETRVDGSPCGAPENLVDPETGLCPAHRPGGREKLREAAMKGAEATKRVWRSKGLDPEELPPLRTPQDAERWAEVLGRAVASGNLTHSQGKAISSLLREWRASHEAGVVSGRLEELRATVAELKSEKKLLRRVK